MVIAGLTRTNIDAFLRTKKGRKTEHILAIVQDDAGNFAVLTNLLYQKNRLGRLFSWRKPVAGQPGHSCEPSVESISHLETKSLAIRHTTPLPDLSLMELFPDKTINLQGSTLNVITILFPPVIMRRFGVNGSVVWYGYNVRLAETLADILNFTVRFIEPAPVYENSWMEAEEL
ncbi:hypothetical protein GWK47_030804 [Chionoecetes opilio]|uniref:Uncharacterized protein n=1 Tax=Chionoecetes opilio TaxID=41210 RepID=A0A8J4YJV5_CHIOP|nr:hypothetical protein GWK47_030804 [Chionoecetes opilio]